MAENERQIREAAETLLTGSINSQRSSYTQQSVTLNTDIISNENIIAGAMQNWRMSAVRRFFCLFVTFDLLLTFLMWLICTMIAGESVEFAFMTQVVHYNIKTSLFDIVIAAILRFSIILLFYACLHLDHWFFVAMTTASTCAFLITKVFLFDWTTCNQPVFQVLLILSSFVLSWVEAWFFDIRVLPQEIEARTWLRTFIENEREPLLRGNPSDLRQYTSTDPNATFFTPMDSQDHSDNEDENYRRQSCARGSTKANEIFPPKPLEKFTPEMIEDYKRQANALVQNCHALLQSKDWQIENIMPNGDIIFYVDRPKPEGRVLKIVGTVHAQPSSLIDKLFDEVELLPSWNKLVSESKILQYIDENTDIVYQATNPHGGGMIGARDFIILRHRIRYSNYYLTCGTSVPLLSIPNRSNVVRAENNISCWAAEPLPNEENKSRVTWIINTNLKGWIPQKFVDKSMNSALTEVISSLRKYLEEPQMSSD
ncbi:StAR-related lipid transfer protein 3 [Habropoda laboriosa]|uniref:StAR-related lipid transfer protein 3 n=1 Tax=Habropoda laboriosa TaxID=597456 RepID=A0A0L7RBS2_9HYME|nr:PREDICTED: stAR-related lipid transfer protein 3 [Habropoda laboriosa]KOC68377.1 StAR-related lipid transfer protein 3 [Habropoda laboriosa]